VDTGNVKVGQKVAIVGGGPAGGETALQLLKDGHKVTMIDMLSFDDITPNYPRGLAFLLSDYKCDMLGSVCLKEITDEGIVIEDKNWKRRLIEADTVIMSAGFRADKETAAKFMDIIPEETYIAGDCVKPGTVTSANHDAFNIAAEL